MTPPNYDALNRHNHSSAELPVTYYRPGEVVLTRNISRRQPWAIERDQRDIAT